jgi:transcriptional regulator with XRE-family HTH domain
LFQAGFKPRLKRDAEHHFLYRGNAEGVFEVTLTRKQVDFENIRVLKGGFSMAATIRKDAPYKAFAERLTALRTNAGMTRAELGDKVGVAGRSIINYENGERIPYGDVCAKMAEVFGITTDELLGIENSALAMAREEAIDRMRDINGKSGAERLQQVYADAANLAGGDLSDEQLLEFSLEMSKMAMLAQQRLRERHSGKKYQSTVTEKAEQTKIAVKAIDDAIIAMNTP